jgi:hypothetical protein
MWELLVSPTEQSNSPMPANVSADQPIIPLASFISLISSRIVT